MQLAPVNLEAETLDQFIDSFMSEVDHSSWYLETLKWYANRPGVDHIVEYGIFQGHSLAAFLSTKPYVVEAYDVTLEHVSIDTLHRLKSPLVQLTIGQRSSLDPERPHGDLLYLDTVHTYHHVQRELAHHANQGCYKYVAVHDANLPQGGGPTVRDACYEFVKQHKGWGIDFDTEYRVGLVVLKRL